MTAKLIQIDADHILLTIHERLCKKIAHLEDIGNRRLAGVFKMRRENIEARLERKANGRKRNQGRD
jgi:hypothetical protein